MKFVTYDIQFEVGRDGRLDLERIAAGNDPNTGVTRPANADTRLEVDL